LEPYPDCRKDGKKRPRQSQQVAHMC
jgi:hypothetical protein